jgi:hypothetical protein
MMNVKTFSTVPCKEESYWQIILLPTITILRSPDAADKYTVVNLEWLFWSVSIFFNDKTRIHSDKDNQSHYTDI